MHSLILALMLFQPAAWADTTVNGFVIPSTGAVGSPNWGVKYNNNFTLAATNFLALDVTTTTLNGYIADLELSTGTLQADLATEVSDRGIADGALAVSTGAIEAAKVDRAGDSMSGPLTLVGSSLTVGGSLLFSAGSARVISIADGGGNDLTVQASSSAPTGSGGSVYLLGASGDDAGGSIFLRPGASNASPATHQGNIYADLGYAGGPVNTSEYAFVARDVSGENILYASSTTYQVWGSTFMVLPDGSVGINGDPSNLGYPFWVRCNDNSCLDAWSQDTDGLLGVGAFSADGSYGAIFEGFNIGGDMTDSLTWTDPAEGSWPAEFRGDYYCALDGEVKSGSGMRSVNESGACVNVGSSTGTPHGVSFFVTDSNGERQDDVVYFTGNQDVGIGTTAPGSRLDVDGVVTSTGLVVNGSVGIGSASPSVALDVAGDVTSTGVVTAASFVGDGSGLTGISAGVSVSSFATTPSVDVASTTAVTVCQSTVTLVVPGDGIVVFEAQGIIYSSNAGASCMMMFLQNGDYVSPIAYLNSPWYQTAVPTAGVQYHWESFPIPVTAGTYNYCMGWTEIANNAYTCNAAGNQRLNFFGVTYYP